MKGNRSSLEIPIRIMAMALVLISGACASAPADGNDPTTQAPSPDTTSTTASNLGGDGLPVQKPSEDYGHRSSRVTGTLTLEPNGCWTVDLGDGPRLLVFPQGYDKPPDDGSLMRSPDGMIIRSGMAIDGVGGIVPTDLMPDVPDGYWGFYIGFCDPERPEMAVLDSIEPAFDPTELGDDALVAVVREAALTESWPCGIGFAVSNEEQTVAVQVYRSDGDGAIEPPIALPDPAWDARVLIGKNLLANNCDDVMEEWEPIREVVAEWPLDAGVLTYAVPVDEGCGTGEAVSATLDGATVSTSTGDIIDLGDLAIVNEAYGCFAG